jgi:hypothetical protein
VLFFLTVYILAMQKFCGAALIIQFQTYPQFFSGIHRKCEESAAFYFSAISIFTTRPKAVR